MTRPLYLDCADAELHGAVAIICAARSDLTRQEVIDRIRAQAAASRFSAAEIASWAKAKVLAGRPLPWECQEVTP